MIFIVLPGSIYQRHGRGAVGADVGHRGEERRHRQQLLHLRHQQVVIYAMVSHGTVHLHTAGWARRPSPASSPRATASPHTGTVLYCTILYYTVLYCLHTGTSVTSTALATWRRRMAAGPRASAEPGACHYQYLVSCFVINAIYEQN